MILPCTSPPNAIYTNMKARKLRGETGPTILAGNKERGPIWPDPACPSSARALGRAGFSLDNDPRSLPSAVTESDPDNCD